MNGHTIVIPAIHHGNLLGCLESMNPDIVRDRVIIIDNTDTGEIADAVHERVFDTVAEQRNLGVATSWNLGCKMGFNEGAEYVTLMSSSMRLGYGTNNEVNDGGMAIVNVADFCRENRQWQYGFESLNGWHLITVSKTLIDTVGWFDELFYPAYMEDCDYVWRMRLAGILEPLGAPRYERKFPWVPTLHYECVQDGFAIEHVPNLHVDFGDLESYYERKWGGTPGFEQYTEPFNGEEQL